MREAARIIRCASAYVLSLLENPQCEAAISTTSLSLAGDRFSGSILITIILLCQEDRGISFRLSQRATDI